MSISVDWHDAEQKVLVVTLIPPIEWAAFETSIDHIVQMATSVKHEIIVVIYPQENPTSRLPDGNALMHMRHLMQKMPTNVKYVAGINEQINPLMRALVDVLGRIGYASRMRPIHSLDEAIHLLG